MFTKAHHLSPSRTTQIQFKMSYPTFFFTNHFNIVLPSTFIYLKLSTSFSFSDQRFCNNVISRRQMEATKLTFLFYFVVIEKKRNDLFRFQGVGFEVSATNDHALNLKRNQTQATGCKWFATTHWWRFIVTNTCIQRYVNLMYYKQRGLLHVRPPIVAIFGQVYSTISRHNTTTTTARMLSPQTHKHTHTHTAYQQHDQQTQHHHLH